ncbi:uncharacterized protein LOC142765261 [Rhipicephalus microplus]|uniref:uncharacterized protein LOC142765261 n=1 Tax=Rhipicephalus microplus TaxID=6941 RepID=UPI003F6BE03C
MKPQFFYSATKARRPRFVPLEDADEMFAQLDNGNLSDVGDTEDEEDDDFVFEETGSNDGVLKTREASDESDESEEEQAWQKTSWCRKAFQKPSADFRGVCDENEPLQGSTTCLNPDQKKEFGVTGALVLHFTSRIPDEKSPGPKGLTSCRS